MLYHRKCKKGFGRDYSGYSRLSVYGSLGVALSAGFGFAVLLALHAGLGWSVGDWWTPVLQAHGHAQVLGWLGLFIVGVSLFFVPRLSGVPLTHPRLVNWAVGLLLSGVCLRSVAQSGRAFGDSDVLALSLPVSAVLEAVGIALYLFLILSTVLKASTDRVALMSVRPFLVASVIGWIGFAVLNVDLSFGALAAGTAVYDLAWSRHAVDLYLGATLLPVALAFSVRTFPLYLRLPAANWGVRQLGIAFALSVGLTWLVDVLVLDQADNGRLWSGLAHVSKGILLLFFVWKLDVLFRRRPPWTSGQIAEATDGGRPTRPGLPDHGEFGRFERLLYLGYGWLVVGAGLEVVLGAYRLAGMAEPVDADALRHIYLAGFLSSLLIGMAPRMLPGFVHQRQVAFPRWVNVTFWLWAVGSGMRILPLLLSPVLPATEAAASAASIAFAASGPIAWTALAVLALNLAVTLRRAETEVAPA